MIIQVENLNKTYRKGGQAVSALRNISFTLAEKRVLGLLGPRGAGKTSLLNILAGLVPADSDTGGFKLFSGSDLQKNKVHLGYCPYKPRFLKNLTIQELLRFSMKVSGGRHNRDRIQRVLDQVDLTISKDTRVRDLSLDSQRRLNLAQALVHSPGLLLLDEPITGMDKTWQERVTAILKEYASQGTAIVFTTTQIQEIESLSTDVLILGEGKPLYMEDLTETGLENTYRVEGEWQGESGLKKRVYTPGNAREFWSVLDELRIREGKVLSIRPIRSQRLIKVYENE